MLRLLRWSAWLGVLIASGFLIYQYTLSQKTPNFQVSSLAKAPNLEGVDYARQPYILVNFFASWCIPCQVEHPILLQLSDDLPIVGIAWKDRKEDTQKFLKDYGDSFSMTLDDPNDAIGKQWEVQGLPATFLINHRGQVLYSRQGMLEQKHFEEIQTILE